MNHHQFTALALTATLAIQPSAQAMPEFNNHGGDFSGCENVEDFSFTGAEAGGADLIVVIGTKAQVGKCARKNGQHYVSHIYNLKNVLGQQSGSEFIGWYNWRIQPAKNTYYFIMKFNHGC